MSLAARISALFTPTERPQLSEKDVLRIDQSIGGVWKPEERCRVIGIRGYYRDSMGKKGQNDRGVNDDAFFVITKDKQVHRFNGNTDPSVFRSGIAAVVPGVYSYTAGMHRPGKPRARPAFRQQGMVKVARDGGGVYTGSFGINIHDGGAASTYSEGCQTLPPSQWLEFRDLMYLQLKTSPEKVKANPYGGLQWAFKYILTTREDCESLLGIKF